MSTYRIRNLSTGKEWSTDSRKVAEEAMSLPKNYSVEEVNDMTTEDNDMTESWTATASGMAASLEHGTRKKAIELWDNITKVVEECHRTGTHVLLYGVPGTGKTTLAYNLAQNACQDYTSLTLHTDMSVQELLGHYVPQGETWTYKDGPLASAFTHGHVVSLNEIDRAAGSVLTCLYGVLDDLQVARITTPTGTLPRHADFLAIATTNQTAESLDLPEALLDRLPVRIEVTMPHPAAVDRLASDAIRIIAWDSYTPGHDNYGKVTLRQLAALDKLMQSQAIKPDLACRAVFGDTPTAKAIARSIAMGR